MTRMDLTMYSINNKEAIRQLITPCSSVGERTRVYISDGVMMFDLLFKYTNTYSMMLKTRSASIMALLIIEASA